MAWNLLVQDHSSMLVGDQNWTLLEKASLLECWFYARQTDKTATLVFKGDNAQYGIGIGTLV